FATVSIPISDWWGGTHKIRQQRLKVEKTKASLDENTELLTLQIVQAENEVKENYFQIEVAKKSIEQASENLKVTNDNFKVGVIGISDLLEAQAMLQNANDVLTDAQCNYQIKVAKYLQATGRYNH
ncbi:MAG: TolC family protein, partial [Bacteroidota bacterium]|nr:TolC family protein [Bacteroidota bacterium]